MFWHLPCPQAPQLIQIHITTAEPLFWPPGCTSAARPLTARCVADGAGSALVAQVLDAAAGALLWMLCPGCSALVAQVLDAAAAACLTCSFFSESFVCFLPFENKAKHKTNIFRTYEKQKNLKYIQKKITSNCIIPR